MNRRLRLLGIVGAGTLAALFALLPASGATARESSEIKHVTITDTGFHPAQVNVGADDTVVWTNDGQQRHTVTEKAGLFSSKPLAPGQTFSFTFNKTGVFSYHDAEHPGLTGKVDVQKEHSEAQSATATPAPPATPTPTATGQASHVTALLTSTSTPAAGGKVQPKPARLPRTGEGEPDIRSYVLLAALLTLALGFGLRSTLARARR
jgi:plastocyanin